jgi:hypothetical protein
MLPAGAIILQVKTSLAFDPARPPSRKCMHTGSNMMRKIWICWKINMCFSTLVGLHLFKARINKKPMKQHAEYTKGAIDAQYIEKTTYTEAHITPQTPVRTHVMMNAAVLDLQRVRSHLLRPINTLVSWTISRSPQVHDTSFQITLFTNDLSCPSLRTRRSGRLSENTTALVSPSCCISVWANTITNFKY